MSWFSEKVEPKLVSDWKSVMKWYSSWAMVVAGAAAATWISVPDSLKDVAPNWVKYTAIVLITGFGLTGRVIRQGAADDSPR